MGGTRPEAFRLRRILWHVPGDRIVDFAVIGGKRWTCFLGARSRMCWSKLELSVNIRRNARIKSCSFNALSPCNPSNVTTRDVNLAPGTCR